MSIKLSFGDIKGQSNATGYEAWIDIENFFLKTERNIAATTGTRNDRENSLPTLHEIELRKNSCSATVGLLNAHLSGTSMNTCEIAFLEGGSNGQPEEKLRFVLSNPIISLYEMDKSSETHGNERLDISFTKIEYRYLEKDDRGVASNQFVHNYDITTGQANA